MSSVLQQASTDYRNYYSQLISIEDRNINSKGEASLQCPVHDDTKGSLKINIYDGRWNCFGCGIGGADPISFYSFLNRCDSQDSVEDLEAIFDQNRRPLFNVMKAHNDLINSKQFLDALFSRGITLESVRKYKLGLDNERVCLPEYGWGNVLRQVIKHDVLKVHSEDRKSIPAISGIGVRLWPLPLLRKRKIWVFEGWLDALLAQQFGMNAVSITGSGANGWNDKFNKYFKDKEVIICFDVDVPGKAAAKELGRKLSSIAEEVLIVDISADGMPSNGDFTDFIRIYGIERFNEIPKVPYKYSDPTEGLMQEISLGDSLNSRYYNQPIRTVGVVTGKAERFSIPKRISLKCNGKNLKKCATCNMSKHGLSKTIGMDKRDIDILKLIRVTDKMIHSFFRQREKISKDCPFLKIEVEKVFTVEELVIIPVVNYNANNASYVSRSVYAVTEGTFVASKPYIMEAIPTPHPKTQIATLLIYSYEETDDNIDSFSLSSSMMDELKVFSANSLEELRAKRAAIYSDYETVTKIFGRHSMLFGMDLVIHSALSFKFRGRDVQKGYVNGLFFGDTRTGKSVTAEKLMEHLKVGDSTSGETLSFAGLVGGVSQTHGSSWSVSWGLMPLNDRKLLKIDEFHGMDEREFSKTSETISSGIARIQKIKGESTMARVRLLILSNLKERGANLEHFQFGVSAITDIMGGYNEDIARLDFAYAVSMKDVKPEVRDTVNNSKPEVYTSELCNALVLWAWSRRPEDIIFTEEAENLILKKANDLCEKYHTSIPLVVDGEQSVKMARLAVACACRFFSTDKSGSKVIVRPFHVEAVYSYLEYAYSKHCMAYDVYSAGRKRKETIANPEQLKQIGLNNFTRDQLLGLEYISVSDIEQCFVCGDRASARVKLAILLANNALYKYNTTSYRKTPAFIKFLGSRDFGELDYDKIQRMDF